MKFDYGKQGIEIDLNSSWNVDIFKPIEQPTIKNPVEELRDSINHPISSEPLKKLIEKKKSIDQICIVVSDATRPVPTNLILKALVDELNSYGYEDDKIIILIATGLHRQSCEEDLIRILGDELKGRLKVIDHVSTDRNSQEYLGETSDKVPIYIDKNYYNSDLKILTGYVEPHFFFGFSGGRKSIVPGISGKETIQANHSAEYIASPYARFGIYRENPMHKNALEAAKIVGVDFIVNVCIDQKHRVTKIAAGDLVKAHESLVDYQLRYAFKNIDNLYDIVICGNGGYPLDLNLYQAVKSMAIGELAVKKGGTIISVNECIEGIGIAQNEFKELLFSGMTPHKIYKKILNKKIIVPDQWEIQILARILSQSEIFIVSELKENEIGNIGLKYAATVEEAIESSLKKLKNNPKMLILPNGPQILPIFNNEIKK